MLHLSVTADRVTATVIVNNIASSGNSGTDGEALGLEVGVEVGEAVDVVEGAGEVEGADVGDVEGDGEG